VGGVRDLLRDAERVLPGVAEFALVEAAAGLRPGTPDNLPLIGRVAGAAGQPGPLVATGHGRNGMLLAPITATAVLALLAGEPVPDQVMAADPARLAPDRRARPAPDHPAPASPEPPDRAPAGPEPSDRAPAGHERLADHERRGAAESARR